MPPRRLGAPVRRPLDIRRLAAQTLLHDLEDAAPPPAADADLATLTRWSVSGLGGVGHLMGLDDWGHVISFHILAVASDGTWAQRVDGSYVRLRDPWPLPLARAPGRSSSPTMRRIRGRCPRNTPGHPSIRRSCRTCPTPF